MSFPGLAAADDFRVDTDGAIINCGLWSEIFNSTCWGAGSSTQITASGTAIDCSAVGNTFNAACWGGASNLPVGSAVGSPGPAVTDATILGIPLPGGTGTSSLPSWVWLAAAGVGGLLLFGLVKR